MAVSGLSFTNQQAYEVAGGFATYGVEYQTGDNGYVTWFNNGKPMWTMYSLAVCAHPKVFRLLVTEKFAAADSVANISQRIIPAEPMYIILNLGISESFGKVRLLNQGAVRPADGRVNADISRPPVSDHHEDRLCPCLSGECRSSKLLPVRG